MHADVENLYFLAYKLCFCAHYKENKKLCFCPPYIILGMWNAWSASCGDYHRRAFVSILVDWDIWWDYQWILIKWILLKNYRWKELLVKEKCKSNKETFLRVKMIIAFFWFFFDNLIICFPPIVLLKVSLCLFFLVTINSHCIFYLFFYAPFVIEISFIGDKMND